MKHEPGDFVKVKRTGQTREVIIVCPKRNETDEPAYWIRESAIAMGTWYWEHEVEND